MLEKPKLRIFQSSTLHRKAGSGNGHSKTITSKQSGAGYSNKPSSKTTRTAGGEWSSKNRWGGAKEKPPKITSSTQRECPCQNRHRWPTQGTSYVVAKTIFRASPARSPSLWADRPLCQQAETARGQPSKTISGPRSPDSKTMWKEELNSHGRET